MPLLLAMTFRVLADRLHDRLAKEGHPDIRPAHGFVVGHLVTSHGARAVELAGYLGVTEQGAGHIIGELERWGYAERVGRPTDGRSQLIIATDKGRSLVARVTAIWQDEEARWSASSTPTTSRALARPCRPMSAPPVTGVPR
ncbi:MarR family winged helix-turn-helix transcriptional regulator [Plantactinospora sonchi]|uniref:MarR family winged helix-turn-helix transcriptional regulator n=1 Tax=Plantactinospora sonchi TaxID=1544735 RepID=A0ABU7RUI5_9ACTN